MSGGRWDKSACPSTLNAPPFPPVAAVAVCIAKCHNVLSISIILFAVIGDVLGWRL